jgi:hypothetical protein
MTAKRLTISLRWTAWFKWLAATLIGLVAGLVVFFLIGVTFGEYLDEAFPEFVFGIFLGTIFGTAFGIAHWVFLRRYVSGIGAWIPATAISFALAAAIIFGLLNPENGEASTGLRIGHAIVVGLSLGVAQWLVLRARVAGPAHLWILFSVGAWILGELTGIALGNVAEEPLPLMAIFLVGASLSGMGMIWLLMQASRHDDVASVTPKQAVGTGRN